MNPSFFNQTRPKTPISKDLRRKRRLKSLRRQKGATLRAKLAKESEETVVQKPVSTFRNFAKKVAVAGRGVYRG